MALLLSFSLAENLNVSEIYLRISILIGPNFQGDINKRKNKGLISAADGEKCRFLRHRIIKSHLENLEPSHTWNFHMKFTHGTFSLKFIHFLFLISGSSDDHGGPGGPGGPGKQSDHISGQETEIKI